MLDVMYDIPGNEKIGKCIVTKASIEGKEQPKLIECERKNYGEKSDSKAKVNTAS